MAKRMSKEEKDRILYLWAEGFLGVEIARDLGRSASTVTKFLQKQETLPEQKERKPVDLLKRDRYGTPLCCKGCKHRRRMHGLKQLMTYCSYANDMETAGYLGAVRGCPVERCTHYERGKPARRYPVEVERGVAQ